MLNYGMIYPDYIFDSWIIDGDYSRTYENRISACDTVFFLDYVGTDNETILKQVLDEAAHSFRIK